MRISPSDRFSPSLIMAVAVMMFSISASGIKSRSLRSILALGVLSVLALSDHASAGYYRWVDKNGVVNYSNFQPLISSGPTADRELMVNEILVLSGLKRQLANIPAVVESQVRERGAKANQGEIKKVAEIMKRSFQVDALQKALREALRSEFDAGQLATLVLWYRSPVAHDLSDAEINAASPERAKKLRAFSAQLQELPPTPSRLQAIERLDAATRSTELALDISAAVGRAMVTALENPSLTPAAFESMMRQRSGQFYRTLKATTVVGLLFTYQSVSEAKLRQYLEFLESDLGRRFTRTVHNAILDAVNASARKISGEIAAGGRSAPRVVPSPGDGPLSRQEPRQEESTLTVSLPESSWALTIPASGFVIEKDQINTDKRSRYLLAHNKATSVNLSVLIEKGSPRSSTECRDYYWGNLRKNSPLKRTDVKMSERGRMALLEYVVKEHQGVRINQKHVNAYLAQKDACVDIHLSKAEFQPREELLLASIVDGARVKEDAPIKEIASVKENAPVPTFALQGPTSVRSYQFPDYGDIQITVLRDWQDSVSHPAGGQPTISFSPSTGREFRVLITMIKPAKKAMNDLKRVRAFVERSGRKLLSTSVEAKLNVEELRGPEAVGYFYSLTDKAPKPDAYKYMTQGAVEVGELMVTFTILSNTKDGPEHRTAVEVLKTARHTPANSRNALRTPL